MIIQNCEKSDYLIRFDSDDDEEEEIDNDAKLDKAWLPGPSSDDDGGDPWETTGRSLRRPPASSATSFQLVDAMAYSCEKRGGLCQSGIRWLLITGIDWTERNLSCGAYEPWTEPEQRTTVQQLTRGLLAKCIIAVLLRSLSAINSRSWVGLKGINCYCFYSGPFGNGFELGLNIYEYVWSKCIRPFLIGNWAANGSIKRLMLFSWTINSLIK